MLGFVLSNYINGWIFLVLGVFVVAWIVGGGYLIRRSFPRYGYAQRLGIGRSMLASFLSGSAGAFAAGVTMLLVMRLTDGRIVFAIGAVIALGAAMFVAFLVLYAMFSLSAKQTLWASMMPLGSVAAVGLLLGTAYLVPTRMGVRRQGKRDYTCYKLAKIFPAYAIYVNKYHKPPASLRVLVEQKLLEPEELRSPLSPDREIGYFYIPAMPKRGEQLQQIFACDYGDNRDGYGRAVLLMPRNRQRWATPKSRWYSEEDFRKLLQLKENADFAKALQKAEGQ